MAADPLSEGLAALSRFLVGDGTVQDTLTRISELAVEALPPVDFAGLTMFVEGRQRTAVFTDDTAPEIDQAQYDTGEGPCLDAFRDQQIREIDSTREEGPWPAFRAAAAAHGIGSTLSFPLVLDKQGIGAMNLYAYQEHAFADADRDRGSPFAAQAA